MQSVTTVLMAWVSGTLGLLVGQSFVTDEKDMGATALASCLWLIALVILAIIHSVFRVPQR